MSSQMTRAAMVSAVVALVLACSGKAMADLSAKEAADLDAEAKATLTKFQAETKGSEAVFANAKGILVCPTITKGGFLVGVESGNCVLTSGAPAPLYYGSSAMKAGLLAGVQSYSMILVLNTNEALANFTSGKREWEMGADASVAVAKLGADGTLNTTNLKAAIVSFIFGGQGLMADVSFSGSRFKKQDVESLAQVKELPTETITVKGTVETIDHAKRVVEIKTADGKFVTLDVPESAPRFSELKVGDKVSVTYNNNVVIRRKPPGEAAVDTASGSVRMGQEARPGGSVTVQRTMTATIAEIDKGTSSMTFVGPSEWKYTRHVVDPEVFDQVKVGDQIDITWSTAVTVSVE